MAGDHKGNDAGVFYTFAGGKNGTTQNDALAIDEHDMPGFSKTNNIYGGSKKFFCVVHTMENPDGLVSNAVHDGDGEAKRIRFQQIVKRHIFEIGLSNALIERALPPRSLFVGIRDLSINTGHESAHNVREV